MDMTCLTHVARRLSFNSTGVILQLDGSCSLIQPELLSRVGCLHTKQPTPDEKTSIEVKDNSTIYAGSFFLLHEIATPTLAQSQVCKFGWRR